VAETTGLVRVARHRIHVEPGRCRCDKGARIDLPLHFGEERTLGIDILRDGLDDDARPFQRLRQVVGRRYLQPVLCGQIVVDQNLDSLLGFIGSQISGLTSTSPQ
jgi:hypothetical protein